MGDADWDEVIFLDRERSAPLWDVGAPGYLAGVGVDPDGQDVLMLVSEEHINVENAPQGCPDQPHEQTGRLPAWARSRVFGPHMCFGVNRRGQPCGIEVSRPGERCRFHRIKASAP
jgi:hypothetical protein